MSNPVKDYSLQQIEEWVSDAMESGATPKEIHDTIVDTIRRRVKYHKACYEEGKQLHELVTSTPLLESVPNNPVTESHFATATKITEAASARDWDEFWKSDDFKLDSPELHSDELDKIKEQEDKPSYMDMIAKGYTMTDDGFWLPPEKTLDDSFERSVREREKSINVSVGDYPDYTELY